MNLQKQREEIREGDIFDYINAKHDVLILPDQDVINALYSHRILNIPELKYNYEARFYRMYQLAGNSKDHMDEVVKDTVILHFCGIRKPWHKSYTGVFSSLYKHYEHLASR